jgi:hypothetical protein
MAALRFDIVSWAAIAALVLVAIGFSFLQFAPSTKADQEDTLAGEWFFTITARIVSGRELPLTLEREGCIASMVEQDAGWNVPMSCSGSAGRVQFTAEIDQGVGTARIEGEVFGTEIEAEGTLEKGSRNCVDAVWSHAGASETIDFTVSGCQERGNRGFVRCTLLNVPVPVAPMGSKDAMIILLREAELPVTHQNYCMYRGDVNVDGEINSVDAHLILQHEAGLIEQFPP